LHPCTKAAIPAQPSFEVKAMTPTERAAVQAHLRKLFSDPRIQVTAPDRPKGSVELKIGNGFIGMEAANKAGTVACRGDLVWLVRND